MKMFVFGSSITSSYWNGAATYYRGIYKHLNLLGHEITFAEPDAYGRQQHRDRGDFSYVRSIVFKNEEDIPGLTAKASACDLVVKHSGVGVFDELLETRVLDCRSSTTRVAFWDVDAPATLARVKQDLSDSFRPLIPQYDFIFTYGGGDPVRKQYEELGAVNCYPIYNALDPETHHPTVADPELQCDLAFVGHRLPDRERRVEEFFFRTARLAPEMRFILGGEGWGSKAMPANVRWIGHVGTSDHNRINCSARMVLNVNRDSMAQVGFSPPTRIFEAAGAGACLITDHWRGVENFFAPEREILVAGDGEEVVCLLRTGSDARCKEMGERMLQRALREHTYASRAHEFESIVGAHQRGQTHWNRESTRRNTNSGGEDGEKQGEKVAEKRGIQGSYNGELIDMRPRG